MAKYTLNPMVAIDLQDYEAALRFYQEVLGFSEQGRKAGDKEACFLAKNALTIFVMNSPEGNTWLSLDTDDLDAAKAELETAGCQVSPAPHGGGYLVVDPYGMRFYLAESD